MPWLETDVRDQRIQFVLTARRPGANVRATCQVFGISRKTGYKWLARERAAGSVAVLGDQSRRPQHSPQRTAAAVTARVAALRQAYGWGGKKLARLLAAEGYRLTPRTIDRIIHREGWTRADAAPAPARRRFARAAPNDLWQLDAKGAYPLAAGGRCHALSLLDDHSRFAVGLSALPTLETAWVQPALVRAFETYGLPDALLLDHGTPWWDAGHAAGLTHLGVFLLTQGIHLIHGRVRHPQTQGKVERFHRTLGERLRWAGVPTTLPAFTRTFTWFQEEYNYVRPHEALGLDVPAQHYTPSRRAYVAQPRPWEYPVDSEVRRVDAHGMLTYRGRRFFLSEALSGQAVACARLDTRVVVHYRQHAVRELHLDTGASVSLLRGGINNVSPMS